MRGSGRTNAVKKRYPRWLTLGTEALRQAEKRMVAETNGEASGEC